MIDLDATLITAHSEKELAQPSWKRGFGFHPLCAFVDHGPSGTGELIPSSSGPGMPGRTPPLITSRRPGLRWCSCPSQDLERFTSHSPTPRFLLRVPLIHELLPQNTYLNF